MPSDSAEDRRIAIAHLEVLRQDARDEIKRRIEQRDKYSIQLTIAIAAIVAVTVSRVEFDRALIAAPLVSIYFTTLILYSYRIHGRLAKYLREKVEPEAARLCGTQQEAELEGFFQKEKAVGIRRLFFIRMLWLVSIGSLVYVWLAELTQPALSHVWILTPHLTILRLGLGLVSISYLAACAIIQHHFQDIEKTGADNKRETKER